MFQREAGALREAGDGDPFRRQAGGEQVPHGGLHGGEGRGEVGLVLRARGEEAPRVPGAVPGAGQQKRDAGRGEVVREAREVGGGAAAPVQQDDAPARGRGGLTPAEPVGRRLHPRAGRGQRAAGPAKGRRVACVSVGKSGGTGSVTAPVAAHSVPRRSVVMKPTPSKE